MNDDQIEIAHLVIHRCRLMGEPMEWRVLCNKELADNYNVNNNDNIANCPECLNLYEAHLDMIQGKFGNLREKIPWIKEWEEDMKDEQEF